MTAGDMPATRLTLTGPARVNGSVRVPGDKSVSHRALLMAAMAPGKSTISGLSLGDDVRRTRNAVEAFGAPVTDHSDGTVEVAGGDLHEPEGVVDCGNSGTGIRLLAGLSAGFDFVTVLSGDLFLRRRPMDRVLRPLAEMGARVDGRLGGRYAPIIIRGGSLRSITYRSPVASAQVKSSILLAGVHADGPTTVVEPVTTRRHTEEMLADFGVEVRVNGTSATVVPGGLMATHVSVPGDPSQAAFWTVAGLIVAESAVRIDGLYLGHGRVGFLSVLRALGADLEIDVTTGTVHASTGTLRGCQVDPTDVASFVDEVPILAVAAAAAQGTTVFSGAEELRVKESDRIASTVAMLKAFGAVASETPDGMVIEGGRPLRGAMIDTHGDHRIAMAAAIAALRAEGTTVIQGWEAVATSYPGFADELNRLTGGSVQATVSADPRK